MRRITKRTVVVALGLLAVVGVPFAAAAGEGRPVNGGARNPSSNPGLNYTSETQLIANTSTYGTRQSNKSDNGGGAIYGCRSKAGGTPAGNQPCLRSSNLVDGLAFEFSSRGVLGGTITVGNGGETTKPFTTNATGVATGLNADRVDGKDATDFAAAGDLLFAAVNASGTVTGGRGAASASYAAGTNTYTVVFDRDVDKCSFTATANAADAGSVPALSTTATTGNTKAVTVDEAGTTATPFHLQVIC